MKIVIIGGGFSGCAAAIAAIKQGAEVELYERTDLLLGVGNVGGIMRNNGRFTATEELIALGVTEIFNITDSLALHKNVDFPGHKHSSLTDISKVEPAIRRLLLSLGVKLYFNTRIIDVIMEGSKLKSVLLNDKTKIDGDVFIETTGSTGPMNNCSKYGNGCVMCVLRCPTFGGRVSISERAGIADIISERKNGLKGAMSGSCEIPRELVDKKLLDKLDKDGVVILPIPKEDIKMDKLSQKVCQQYALIEFAENVILLDTGHIKLMTSYYPLEKLRKIPGLENVKYIDPQSGGNGNSIRYLAASPRDNRMQVLGIDNLFCAGEKSGFFVGHTEAIGTGTLAGYNAVKYLLGEKLLELPRELSVGDIIAYANESLMSEIGKTTRHTFSGGEYFDRMITLGLYLTDINLIKKKVEFLSLTDIFK